MAKQYTMIRVTWETQRKLAALGHLWQEAYADGMNHLPADPDRSRASYDRIIAELIRRDEAHRNRAKNSRRQKPAQGDQAEGEG